MLNSILSGIPITRSDSLCVYSNTGSYNVVATGNGPGGNFIVSSSPTSNIPFKVFWQDEANAAVELFTGNSLNGRVSTSNTTNCGGGATNNTELQITFAAIDLAAATAGVHTGTLTLLITPE